MNDNTTDLEKMTKSKLYKVAGTCAQFVTQLAHHRAMNSFRKNGITIKCPFWITIFNNSIDMAVLNWLHLFGSDSDELHWKKNVCEVDSFRGQLLGHIAMSQEDWENYWNETKGYRDKTVAHIDSVPHVHVPDMSVAIKAADFYYQWIFEVIKRDYPNVSFDYWPVDLNDYLKLKIQAVKELLEKIGFDAALVDTN
ncbi:hypothetical protein [Desulfatibacillum aliphaticivorans]|uniref:hypothetical protein n=1 Tax=Desulfatibacillum aliphaticivorans TaxID=218208 RepID=UPI0004886FCF|nr:hypothetical protein [Desulfatibacillum aliphaticivorans]